LVLLAATDQTLLAQFLLFLSAFAGPLPNSPQPMPWQHKVKALAHFASTGDARECNKILAAIRKKKTWAEDFLKAQRKAKKEIEAGIDNLQRIVMKAGAQAAMWQRGIESRKRTLSTMNFLEPRMRAFLNARVKEEKAFNLIYRCIEKGRKKLAAP
jgi:hypothetical protein